MAGGKDSEGVFGWLRALAPHIKDDLAYHVGQELAGNFKFYGRRDYLCWRARSRVTAVRFRQPPPDGTRTDPPGLSRSIFDAPPELGVHLQDVSLNPLAERLI